ncbi:MAG: carboxymuconolactone decarboxylase family protein [Acidobacteria bacterium]|nr:carboxymuconolactone decarboxylase family protein [Acidobacteriota bacterium]
MDERTRELIAVGVSVGVHCQPCLEYHLSKARELKIAEGDVREAIEIGTMVEKGALTAMRKFVDQALAPPEAPEGPCCSGSTTSCCG